MNICSGFSLESETGERSILCQKVTVTTRKHAGDYLMKLRRVRDQVYSTCCCEFFVRSAFLSLVWHMHDVCLLHGHVAHSSHYG